MGSKASIMLQDSEIEEIHKDTSCKWISDPAARHPAAAGVSLISKSPRIAANRSRLNSGANNPLRPSVAVCITSFK